MKCPSCGKETPTSQVKEWFFHGFEVSRYVCSECGAGFNVYKGEHKTFTIPKSSSK